jgi:hypothetical protein
MRRCCVVHGSFEKKKIIEINPTVRMGSPGNPGPDTQTAPVNTSSFAKRRGLRRAHTDGVADFGRRQGPQVSGTGQVHTKLCRLRYSPCTDGSGLRVGPVLDVGPLPLCTPGVYRPAGFRHTTLICLAGIGLEAASCSGLSRLSVVSFRPWYFIRG